MKRSKLIELLKEPLEKRSEVSIRYDCPIHSFEEISDHVKLYLKNNETPRVDVLVGCDGITSFVREKLFPDSKPVFSGHMAVSGISQCEYSPFFYSVYRILNASGFSFLSMPVDNSGAVAWEFSRYTPDYPKDLDINKIEGDIPFWSKPGDLEICKKIAKVFPLFVSQLIENATSDVNEFASFYFPSSDTWHSNRVGVIGDAAHAAFPWIGQSANMAICDAACLAREIIGAYDSTGDHARVSTENISTAFSCTFQSRLGNIAIANRLDKASSFSIHSSSKPISKIRDYAFPKLLSSPWFLSNMWKDFEKSSKLLDSAPDCATIIEINNL